MPAVPANAAAQRTDALASVGGATIKRVRPSANGEVRRPVHAPAIARPTTEPERRQKRRAAALRTVLRKDQTATPVAPDDPFAYTACVRCHRIDWLVRTGKNEDGSFRYWCLRCSRSFKTDVRLAHAVKPFATAGSILVVLALLANFH